MKKRPYKRPGWTARRVGAEKTDFTPADDDDTGELYLNKELIVGVVDGENECHLAWNEQDNAWIAYGVLTIEEDDWATFAWAWWTKPDRIRRYRDPSYDGPGEWFTFQLGDRTKDFTLAEGWSESTHAEITPQIEKKLEDWLRFLTSISSRYADDREEKKWGLESQED